MSTLDQSQVAGSTLGYASQTTNSSTASTTSVQITGLTATVTIPSGGRRVKITAYVGVATNSTIASNTLTIWDGTVGTGTQLAQANINTAGTATPNAFQLTAIAVVTPSAGSKTYNVGYSCSAGTLATNTSANCPAFILVELI